MDSCSEAARPQSCVVATEDSLDLARARVTFPSASSVRVEVEPDPGHQLGIDRSMEFRAADGEEDRWRALGLVVGSLLSGGSRPVSDEAEPGSASVPPKPSPRHPMVWMEGGAELGKGLEPGPLRRGGWIRVAYRPKGLPVFAGVGAGFAGSDRAAHDVKPSWTTFALGIGLAWTLEPVDLALRPRLDLIVERAVAETGGAATRADSGGRSLPGTAASLELAWPATGPVSAVLGGAARFLSGGTTVRVGPEKTASFPAVGYGALIAVQVALVP